MLCASVCQSGCCLRFERRATSCRPTKIQTAGNKNQATKILNIAKPGSNHYSCCHYVTRLGAHFLFELWLILSKNLNTVVLLHPKNQNLCVQVKVTTWSRVTITGPQSVSAFCSGILKPPPLYGELCGPNRKLFIAATEKRQAVKMLLS